MFALTDELYRLAVIGLGRARRSRSGPPLGRALRELAGNGSQSVK
jgi:hypothetical protein